MLSTSHAENLGKRLPFRRTHGGKVGKPHLPKDGWCQIFLDVWLKTASSGKLLVGKKSYEFPMVLFDESAALCELLPMRNLHRSLSTARHSSGFTLVELLVVIGIIAILAGVALGPIASGIRQAKESAAMQSCRAIALAEFSYSNDNANYPDGADAGVLANQLFTGNYVSDPSVFRISGAGAHAPTTTTIAAANVDYDFLGYATVTPANSIAGLPASTPDVVPVVWSPDSEVVVPSGNTGQAFTPTGGGFFGKDGVAIAYKSNNAFFQTPQKSTATGVYPPLGEVLVVQPGVAVDPPTGNNWAIRKGIDQ